MTTEMISQFIDDELDLDEKMTFVGTVRTDAGFADETLALLAQEKRIRAEIVEKVPAAMPRPRFSFQHFFKPLFQPMGIAASALAAAVLLLIVFTPQPAPGPINRRFVIYRPDVAQVEITGTFTDWQRIPMNRIGDSGYWELSLNLPRGEHRFAYILENRQSFPDPTLPARERDDFGGENSIFYAENTI